MSNVELKNEGHAQSCPYIFAETCFQPSGKFIKCDQADKCENGSFCKNIEIRKQSEILLGFMGLMFVTAVSPNVSLKDYGACMLDKPPCQNGCCDIFKSY